jgi:7-carboxy-7-deazaguanine synthase
MSTVEPSSDTEPNGGLRVTPVPRSVSPTSLLIRESFGPTWQGEGQHTGRLAYFIRLGGCNLHCNFCDEPKTWVFDQRHAEMHRGGTAYDPKAVLRRAEPSELVTLAINALPNHGCIVITGGEPMLQAERLTRLIGDIVTRTGSAHCIEIETAGTILPPKSPVWKFVKFNVSPKLAHSGNARHERYRPAVLFELRSRQAEFKFVVRDEADLAEVRQIVADVGIRNEHVWIMPEGSTTEVQLERMRELADAVLALGYNLSPRLHILIWGNEEKR